MSLYLNRIYEIEKKNTLNDEKIRSSEGDKMYVGKELSPWPYVLT